MRISDWSSDVCASDLPGGDAGGDVCRLSVADRVPLPAEPADRVDQRGQRHPVDLDGAVGGRPGPAGRGGDPLRPGLCGGRRARSPRHVPCRGGRIAGALRRLLSGRVRLRDLHEGERTAYLKIRLDWLFSIYLVFVVAVIARYLFLSWRGLRGAAPGAGDPTQGRSGV